MAGWLEHTSTWLVDHQLAPYLFALLLLLAFAEAAFLLGFVLPGETALVVGGALCATGVLPLALFLPAAVLAAIAGDSVGYEVGRRFGGPLRASRLGLRVGEDRWAVADAFFARHGGKAVFLGRSQAVLRAMVPSLAGMSGMRYRTFLPWNALGALVWGGGMVMLGYVFARSVGTLEKGLTYWAEAVLAMVAVALSVWFLRARRRRRGSAHTADAPPEQPSDEASSRESA
jgi:membrane-associated protein